VAESAKGAPEVARKSGDDRLEKRTTLLTNTVCENFLSKAEVFATVRFFAVAMHSSKAT
jgi:hypothetical protein